MCNIYLLFISAFFTPPMNTFCLHWLRVLCIRGSRFFKKKSSKFENRHVDLDREKNSKTILKNTFFKILSRLPVRSKYDETGSHVFCCIQAEYVTTKRSSSAVTGSASRKIGSATEATTAATWATSRTATRMCAAANSSSAQTRSAFRITGDVISTRWDMHN
jgi:hypothetical protein